MPVIEAIGFEDAIQKAATECGWSESTKNAVMVEFLRFAGQFDNNLLNVFNSYLENRVLDEKRAFEEIRDTAPTDDDEESCWECGGRLKYIESKANGDLCECVRCGAEQMTSAEDDEDEEDDEDDFDDDDDLDDDFDDDDEDDFDDDDDLDDDFEDDDEDDDEDDSDIE